MKVDLHCHSYYSDGVYSPSEVVEFANKECLFEYRDSIIKKVPDRYIVLSAKFDSNNKTDRIDDLKLKTKERISDKVDREPFGYSFGSTFMNARLPAWECVKSVSSNLNLKSISYSKKHYNWIVNDNNSSGEDIMNLIRETQRLVKDKLDIELINEVKII